MKPRREAMLELCFVAFVFDAFTYGVALVGIYAADWHPKTKAFLVACILFAMMFAGLRIIVTPPKREDGE